jgi:hypothetical protein
VIDLAHHGVLVKTKSVDGEARRPVVVAQRRHLFCAPLLLTRVTIEQARAHQVVPIAEDIRLYAHLIPGYALYGKAATVDLRRHPFHDDAAAPVHRLGRCCCGRI